jgi:hypothetical protein
MKEILSVRIGSRFIFVNVVPLTFFLVLIGGLIAAGAPNEAPAWIRLTATVERWGWAGALIATASVVILSMVVHPLSYPLIQLLEGYWAGLPLGGSLQRLIAARHKRWRDALRPLPHQKPHPANAAELRWLPDDFVLPTSLGNTLRAGEIRAGDRYGFETRTALLPIMILASPAVRTDVTDTRNQLDAAARLCILSTLAVPTTIVLLWPHGPWLLVPLACYFLAWTAYRSAVTAAKRFCEALSLAFDLHHLQLWDALSLPRPTDLEDEESKAEALSRLLDGTQALSFEERELFAWLAPGAAPDRFYDVSLGVRTTPPAERNPDTQSKTHSSQDD